MPAEPLDKKFEAFNWNVISARSTGMASPSLPMRSQRPETKGKPTMILMHTVKGKGVSFMENQAGWHGKAPNAEQYAQAMSELEARVKELEVL